MKVLLAGTVAALFAFAVFTTSAAPLPTAPSLSAPSSVPSADEDKDKEKEKKDG